ncbi:MAG: hypothetical protein ABSG66_11640 [Stellaceae bacterium]|jgi:hypothetical protein
MAFRNDDDGNWVVYLRQESRLDSEDGGFTLKQVFTEIAATLTGIGAIVVLLLVCLKIYGYN